MEITIKEEHKISELIKKRNLPTRQGFNAYNWIGTVIKNIRSGKIGWVVADSNGRFRVLTVKYSDGGSDEIIMNNIGSNPIETKKFRYLDNFEWSSFGL